jgi:hypothetical protein
LVHHGEFFFHVRFGDDSELCGLRSGSRSGRHCDDREGFRCGLPFVRKIVPRCALVGGLHGDSFGGIHARTASNADDQLSPGLFCDPRAGGDDVRGGVRYYPVEMGDRQPRGRQALLDFSVKWGEESIRLGHGHEEAPLPFAGSLTLLGCQTTNLRHPSPAKYDVRGLIDFKRLHFYYLKKT